MVGIATLAIDESSTFMNVASATAREPSASLPPVSGAGSVLACASMMTSQRLRQFF